MLQKSNVSKKKNRSRVLKAPKEIQGILKVDQELSQKLRVILKEWPSSLNRVLIQSVVYLKT